MTVRRYACHALSAEEHPQAGVKISTNAPSNSFFAHFFGEFVKI